MTKSLLMGQAKASLIYGLYTAFVYFTPIIGAMSPTLAGTAQGGDPGRIDHGHRPFHDGVRAAVLVARASSHRQRLFLPSLPSQIGPCTSDDPRRHRAYNVYYVGVNLGAFLAPRSAAPGRDAGLAGALARPGSACWRAGRLILGSRHLRPIRRARRWPTRSASPESCAASSPSRRGRPVRGGVRGAMSRSQNRGPVGDQGSTGP